eukprot:1148138-Alexandrium_andersonii.AAC.1
MECSPLSRQLLPNRPCPTMRNPPPNGQMSRFRRSPTLRLRGPSALARAPPRKRNLQEWSFSRVISGRLSIVHVQLLSRARPLSC